MTPGLCTVSVSNEEINDQAFLRVFSHRDLSEGTER